MYLIVNNLVLKKNSVGGWRHVRIVTTFQQNRIYFFQMLSSILTQLDVFLTILIHVTKEYFLDFVDTSFFVEKMYYTLNIQGTFSLPPCVQSTISRFPIVNLYRRDVTKILFRLEH